MVAASATHASGVVASTTHLPMAMAGPWTVRVPTHGRVSLTSYGVHATARVVDARYVWMMLQDLSASRVVAAFARHARAVLVSTTHMPMAKAGPWTVRVPTRGQSVALTSYGVMPQRGPWMRGRYG